MSRFSIFGAFVLAHLILFLHFNLLAADSCSELWSSRSVIFSSFRPSTREALDVRGSFIVPNEFRGYRFGTFVQNRTEALISVGTFRAFDRAAQGRFSHLIALDADEGVVSFNKLLQVIIRSSPDRISFLAKLFLGNPDEAVLRALTQAYQKGRNRSLFHALRSRFQPDLLSDALSESSFAVNERELNQILISLNHTEWQKSLSRILGNDFEHNFEHDSSTLGRMERTGALEFSILGNDDVYQKVRDMELGGRIVSVLGDLSGTHVIREIGEFLRLQKIRVSAIDVSNSIDHIAWQSNEAGLNRFIENVSSLPLSTDAITLLSTQYYWNHDLWTYYGIEARHLYSAIQDGIRAHIPWKKMNSFLAQHKASLPATASADDPSQ
jgi:hypothetical protein